MRGTTDERIEMGFGDKFKDLAKQAQDAVAERKEQIVGAVDHATTAADQRTGGKYTDKLTKVNQKAEAIVEKLSSSEQPASGGEPAAPAGEPAAPGPAPVADAEPPAGAYKPPAFE